MEPKAPSEGATLLIYQGLAHFLWGVGVPPPPWLTAITPTRGHADARTGEGEAQA